MEANDGWLARARRGVGIRGGPEGTRTAYFYNGAFNPYGRVVGPAPGPGRRLRDGEPERRQPRSTRARRWTRSPRSIRSRPSTRARRSSPARPRRSPRRPNRARRRPPRPRPRRTHPRRRPPRSRRPRPRRSRRPSRRRPTDRGSARRPRPTASACLSVRPMIRTAGSGRTTPGSSVIDSPVGVCACRFALPAARVTAALAVPRCPRRRSPRVHRRPTRAADRGRGRGHRHDPVPRRRRRARLDRLVQAGDRRHERPPGEPAGPGAARAAGPRASAGAASRSTGRT